MVAVFDGTLEDRTFFRSESDKRGHRFHHKVEDGLFGRVVGGIVVESQLEGTGLDLDRGHHGCHSRMSHNNRDKNKGLVVKGRRRKRTYRRSGGSRRTATRSLSWTPIGASLLLGHLGRRSFWAHNL